MRIVTKYLFPLIFNLQITWFIEQLEIYDFFNSREAFRKINAYNATYREQTQQRFQTAAVDTSAGVSNALLSCFDLPLKLNGIFVIVCPSYSMKNDALTLFDLPWNDILVPKIMPYLQPSDWLNLRSVCKQSNQLVSHYFKFMRNLDLSAQKSFPKSVWKVIWFSLPTLTFN